MLNKNRQKPKRKQENKQTNKEASKANERASEQEDKKDFEHTYRYDRCSPLNYIQPVTEESSSFQEV